MIDFTINNMGPSSVTYQGVTITSGASYAVVANQTDFATDGYLLADLVVGIASVTINGRTLLGALAATLLIQMTLISFSGVIGGTTPQRAMFLGTQSPTGTVSANKSNDYSELITQFSNSYAHITGNTTSTVKSGSGRIHGIMLNRNWTGGSVTLYDNTAGSGTKIAVLDFGTPAGGLLSTTGCPGPVYLGPLGLEFTTGLTAVTSGSANNDITILYK